MRLVVVTVRELLPGLCINSQLTVAGWRERLRRSRVQSPAIIGDVVLWGVTGRVADADGDCDKLGFKIEIIYKTRTTYAV